MNLISLKKADKFDPKGVEVEREYRGDELFSVKVKLPDGKSFTVSKGSYSEICLLVPAPPKMVKRWRVNNVTEVVDCVFSDQETASKVAIFVGGDVEEFEVEEPQNV